MHYKMSYRRFKKIIPFIFNEIKGYILSLQLYALFLTGLDLKVKFF